MSIDQRPPRLGIALTGGAALLAVGAEALAGPAALVGLAGLVSALVGVGWRRRGVLAVGAGLLFGGTLTAGLAGAGIGPVLLATLGSILTWDVGEHALGIGEQLGAAAETRRLVLVHAATSLLVGVGAALLAFLAYAFSIQGQSIAALAVILLGVGVLVMALEA
jgi:hypothetical protein